MCKRWNHCSFREGWCYLSDVCPDSHGRIVTVCDKDELFLGKERCQLIDHCNVNRRTVPWKSQRSDSVYVSEVVIAAYKRLNVKGSDMTIIMSMEGFACCFQPGAGGVPKQRADSEQAQNEECKQSGPRRRSKARSRNTGVLYQLM